MSLTNINRDNFYQKEVIGNVRTAQEDSHDMEEFTPNGAVFVVCDGMGGHVGGKQASSIAVKSILECLKIKHANPIQALNEALQFANMQILGYANEHPELRGMGTTVCILLLQDDKAYIAHVGDSRIYLYLGKEQKLNRITKDHSYVQTLVDVGEISDADAENHPNKNRILKALGIKQALEPTISKSPILPKNGDVFLVCSDGLNGMISDRIMEDTLMDTTSIEQKGGKLIQLALEAGGNDNITVQMVQISNSPHKKSTFQSFNQGKLQPPISKPKKTTSKRLIISLSLILSLLIIGGTAYYLYSEKQNKEKTEKKMLDEIDAAEKNCNDIGSKIAAKNAELHTQETILNTRKAACEAQKEDLTTKEIYLDQNKTVETIKSELKSLNIQETKAKNKLDSLNNLSKPTQPKK